MEKWYSSQFKKIVQTGINNLKASLEKYKKEYEKNNGEM